MRRDHRHIVWSDRSMIAVVVDHEATLEELANASGGGRGQDRVAWPSQRLHFQNAELGQGSAAELDVARWPDRVERQVGIESRLNQGGGLRSHPPGVG